VRLLKICELEAVLPLGVKPNCGGGMEPAERSRRLPEWLVGKGQLKEGISEDRDNEDGEMSQRHRDQGRCEYEDEGERNGMTRAGTTRREQDEKGEQLGLLVILATREAHTFDVDWRGGVSRGCWTHEGPTGTNG